MKTSYTSPEGWFVFKPFDIDGSFDVIRLTTKESIAVFDAERSAFLFVDPDTYLNCDLLEDLIAAAKGISPRFQNG